LKDSSTGENNDLVRDIDEKERWREKWKSADTGETPAIRAVFERDPVPDFWPAGWPSSAKGVTISL
jgi:hypothetical protein